MFKMGDKVSYIGHKPSTQKKPDSPDGDYIIVPGKEIVVEGVIGSLHVLYIPVKLPDGEIRHILHADLTFGKGNKCSFKSRLPEWKGIKNGREIIIPGKPIVVRGEAVLRGLHLPVLVDGEPRQIPYEKLTFEKEAK